MNNYREVRGYFKKHLQNMQRCANILSSVIIEMIKSVTYR